MKIVNVIDENAEVMSLPDYIAAKFRGSQTSFAYAQGVKLPQVTQWINKNFIVVNDELHSPRRKLNQMES